MSAKPASWREAVEEFRALAKPAAFKLTRRWPWSRWRIASITYER